MDQVIDLESNKAKIDELNKAKNILYSKLKSKLKNKIDNGNPHRTQREKEKIYKIIDENIIENFEITIPLYYKGRKDIIETIIDDIEERSKEDHNIKIIIPKQILYRMVKKLPYKGIEFMNIACEHKWKKNSGLDSIRCFKCKWFLDRLHRAKCISVF